MSYVDDLALLGVTCGNGQLLDLGGVLDKQLDFYKHFRRRFRGQKRS